MPKILKENFFFMLFTATILCLYFFVISPVVVKGQSMEPTLTNWQYMYQLKLEEVERFDIVVFKANEKEKYIKRVIGLPGDEVTYDNGELTINGQSYQEDYTKEEFTESYSFTVPAGSYFVLGDNRNHSTDSRVLGFIEAERIIGVAHSIF